MTHRAWGSCLLGLMVWLAAACSSSSTPSGASSGGASSGGAGSGGGPSTGGANAGTCTPGSATLTCNANSVPYSCTGSAQPSQLKPPVDCLVGFTPLNGVSAHCCIVGPQQTTCGGDPSVSCAAPRMGYSCTGADTPAQADQKLTCITGATSNGKTAYCCATYAAPQCKLAPYLAGCKNIEFRFYCDIPAKPQDSDADLVCDNGAFAINDQRSYCCSAGAASFTKTCMRDASIPCGTTVGYSCTGTDIPSQSDPSITCGTPAINNGKTAYCCSG